MQWGAGNRALGQAPAERAEHKCLLCTSCVALGQSIPHLSLCDIEIT